MFHRQGKDPSVQEETQIQVHIFMSHLPQLEMERHIETQTDTLWRSGFVVFLSNVPDGDLVTNIEINNIFTDSHCKKKKDNKHCMLVRIEYILKRTHSSLFCAIMNLGRCAAVVPG